MRQSSEAQCSAPKAQHKSSRHRIGALLLIAPYRYHPNNNFSRDSSKKPDYGRAGTKVHFGVSK